jgi:hypothetical protein
MESSVLAPFERAYSATRNTIDKVARERTTPTVIEPAMSAIVTIAQYIGGTRPVHQHPALQGISLAVSGVLQFCK